MGHLWSWWISGIWGKHQGMPFSPEILVHAEELIAQSRIHPVSRAFVLRLPKGDFFWRVEEGLRPLVGSHAPQLGVGDILYTCCFKHWMGVAWQFGPNYSNMFGSIHCYQSASVVIVYFEVSVMLLSLLLKILRGLGWFLRPVLQVLRNKHDKFFTLIRSSRHLHDLAQRLRCNLRLTFLDSSVAKSSNSCNGTRMNILWNIFFRHETRIGLLNILIECYLCKLTLSGLLLFEAIVELSSPSSNRALKLSELNLRVLFVSCQNLVQIDCDCLETKIQQIAKSLLAKAAALERTPKARIVHEKDHLWVFEALAESNDLGKKNTLNDTSLLRIIHIHLIHLMT